MTRPGARVHGSGEAELVWLSGKCGEVGSLSAIPDTCSSCGVAREELYVWTED